MVCSMVEILRFSETVFVFVDLFWPLVVVLKVDSSVSYVQCFIH